jgi:hypothetical protein
VRSSDSIGMAVGLLLATCLVTSQARAEPTRELASPAIPAARTEVLLAIVGSGAETARGSVVALLDRQLHAISLTLVEQQPASSVSDWATGASRSKRALLAIVLDTKQGSGWRLVVVDVARGRAIARELPGGVQEDAASVEAVASIVISAASALREGLEVASAPVEAVVGDRAAVSRRAAIPESKRAGGGSNTVVHGAIGAAVASFASGAPTTEGGMLALGLAWRHRIEARLFGSLFWPVPVHSAFGEFRVNRAIVGATSGPVFSTRAFSFIPEVGVLVERLSRSSTVPAEGVFVAQPVPLYRVGGVLAMRLRWALAPPLSLELTSGAAYLGRSVQFSARNGSSAPLLEIGPVMGFAQLGIDIATE